MPGNPCPDVLPPLQTSNAGGWVLLGVVLVVVAYEAWAAFTGHPTISQWSARKTRGHPWLKVCLVAAIGLLLWHLVQGGPL